MNIKQILSITHTLNNVQEDTKKGAFELISQLASIGEDINSKEILEELFNRERLGSTNLGKGIAVPHCRIDGIKLPIAVLVHLEKPIHYDDNDSDPVDILFTIIVPKKSEQEHLEILSAIAQAVKNKNLLNQIRNAENDEQLYKIAIKGISSK